MIMNFRISLTEFLEIEESIRIDLMHRVIQSSIDGNHYMLIGHDILNWVKNNLKLNTLQKNELEYLIGIRNSKSDLLSEAKIILNVKKIGRITKINRSNWCIGCVELSRSDYLDKPEILVENIKYDGNMYKFILKLLENDLIERYGINVQLSYSVCNGGGNTTCDVLEDIVKEKNKLVVCICDSDQSVPDGHTPNSTLEKAKNMKKSIEEKNVFFGDVIETPCREIENFIPFELVEKLSTNKDFRKKFNLNNSSIGIVRDFISDQIFSRNNKHLYLFFDVKSGVDIKKVIESCKISNDNKYKTKKYNVKVYNVLIENQYNFLTFRVGDEKENYQYRIYTDDKNYTVEEFVDTISNSVGITDECFSESNKIDDYEIDGSKFDWFLDKYKLSLENISNFKIAGIGGKIINDFLELDDLEKQYLFLPEMNEDYWEFYFKDWFESILWYFFSSAKQRFRV